MPRGKEAKFGKRSGATAKSVVADDPTSTHHKAHKSSLAVSGGDLSLLPVSGMDQPLVSSPEDIGGDDELALVQSDDEEIDEYGAEDGADDVDERAMSPRKERLKDAKGSPIKTAPAPKKTATKKATNSKKKTKLQEDKENSPKPKGGSSKIPKKPTVKGTATKKTGVKKSAEKPPTGKKSPKKTADKNTPKKVAVKKAGKDLKAKSKATIKKKTQKEESSDYDMDVDVVERDEQTKAQEKKKTTKRKSDGAPPDSERSPKKAKLTAKARMLPGLACSGLDAEDKGMVETIIKSKGGFVYCEEFSPAVTHVVVGDKRTLKVIQAIAAGVWLVTPEWLYASIEIEGKKYAGEAKYEAKTAFPGCRRSRMNKESGEPKIFSGKKIFITGNVFPDIGDLEALVIDQGAEVVDTYKDCDYCISSRTANRPKKGDAPNLTTEWILDCVTHCKLMDTEGFRIGEN